MDKEQFFKECAFAKVVTLADGEFGILINGMVFQMKGFLGSSYTEYFVSALRNSAPRDEGLMSATVSADKPKFYSGFDTLKAD